MKVFQLISRHGFVLLRNSNGLKASLAGLLTSLSTSSTSISKCGRGLRITHRAHPFFLQDTSGRPSIEIKKLKILFSGQEHRRDSRGYQGDYVKNTLRAHYHHSGRSTGSVRQPSADPAWIYMAQQAL